MAALAMDPPTRAVLPTPPGPRSSGRAPSSSDPGRQHTVGVGALRPGGCTRESARSCPGSASSLPCPVPPHDPGHPEAGRGRQPMAQGRPGRAGRLHHHRRSAGLVCVTLSACEGAGPRARAPRRTLPHEGASRTGLPQARAPRRGQVRRHSRSACRRPISSTPTATPRRHFPQGWAGKRREGIRRVSG
jgi:hypothetical protein